MRVDFRQISFKASMSLQHLERKMCEVIDHHCINKNENLLLSLQKYAFSSSSVASFTQNEQTGKRKHKPSVQNPFKLKTTGGWTSSTLSVVSTYHLIQMGFIINQVLGILDDQQSYWMKNVYVNNI